MTELYSRQRELQLNVPASATVVGVGGVGSWVATFLAMSGVGKLYLYDPDTLEPSNLNRIPLPSNRSGASKVRALREWLISLRPEAVVAANQCRADPLILVPTVVLFDCTDDWPAREPLYRWAQKNGVRYVRAGYDGGEHITVAHSLPWQAGAPLARYDVVPSWVVPAAMVAALAVYSVLCPDRADGLISTDITSLVEAVRSQL